MDLLSFYGDAGIRSLVGKYLDANEVERRFAKSAEDIAARECLIPVLGTQGAGKSSFLNAVLFGDILLPVDADETTCIPTAVKYGADEKPQAFVVFDSGDRKKVPCSEAGLSEFVHQEKNPGNQKGVACIEILLHHPLLKDGIVFVDLPGVGSITAANQKTTTDYLQKCTAAIFMLRTVPPITQSESVFIQGALPLMGRVFWVQNQWTDESKDEVNEGRAHNHKVLQDIAVRLNIPKTSIAEPDVVCVKRALDGRVSDNAAMVEKSGINAFRDSVVAFAKDWRKEIFAGKKADGITMLSAAAVAARKRHEQLVGDADAERAKIVAEKRKVEEILENNTKLVREARDFLADQKSEVGRLIDSECTKFSENLRNGVRDVIDNGLVDSQRLFRAYEDILKKKCLPDLFNVLQPAFLEIGQQLHGMLSGVQELFDGDMSMETDAFLGRKRQNAFSKKNTKVQALYAPVGNVGGAIAGAAIGSIIPGVGTAIGFVIGGLLGGLCGGWGAGKLKQYQLERQKEASRQELFAIVEDEQRFQHKGFVESLERLTEQLDQAIRDWLRNQKDAVDKRYRQAVADLSKPADEKAQEANVAEADALRLESLKKELEAI